MIHMTAAFFADCFSISEHTRIEVTPGRLAAVEETLCDWIEDEGTRLFFISENGEKCGILILKARGNVVWIEDLYVKSEMRGRGIASRSIALADEYAAAEMHAPAVCMDVIPQNEAALKLYRSLGYDTIFIVTLRKSLTEKKRTDPVSFLGHEFFM